MKFKKLISLTIAATLLSTTMVGCGNKSNNTTDNNNKNEYSVSCTIFKHAGPNIKPANKAPTTWGIWHFLDIIPNNLVESKIKAMSKM